ncbi:MAG: glycosyltransferase family 2 protein [Chitinispirillia bacterium]|nr:glycosyltransferase family 2 protein [Chitinispirillia bacterium]MCL2241911.1 glycosyltransferase family 2 protein [Chitinispirillia bacterium]
MEPGQSEKKRASTLKAVLKVLLPPALATLIRRAQYGMKRTIHTLALSRYGRHTKALIRENIEITGDFHAALNEMFFDYPKTYPPELYINSCKNKNVALVKPASATPSGNAPVLLCVVKNDFEKVKAQVEYHRRIGITHFAYIDNISNDGVFEWLSEQNDVSLFRTSEKFSDIVKEAWKKQAADVLGYGKWYLTLDPDEFFSYPGIENTPLCRYIEFLESKNIRSIPALMVDMYSKEGLFKSISGDFIKDYCFFDTGTYTHRRWYGFQDMYKGPRWRLFHSGDMLMHTGLTKYPLTKLTKSMVMSTHKNHPAKLNFATNGPAAFLLHYKFLPDEKAKYEEFAKGGIDSLANREYRQMAKVYSQNPELSFYYGGSQKFDSSIDLMKINITDKKFFKEFLAYCAKRP